MRRLYLAAWLFLVLSALLVASARGRAAGPDVRYAHPPVEAASGARSEAAGWFAEARPHCNPVEVETRLAWRPPPAGVEGVSFGAACLALAGRIDDARARIEGLEPAVRWRAAGVVFGVAHPAADAGDDRSAGPIMELVVEFWPNHHMALYHAGMARLGLGDRTGARRHLERFLELYEVEDGWTASARRALADMEGS